MDMDRISELPDHILHHILSFLTSRAVVEASTLSKRWRNLWASMPFLYFNDADFDKHENFISCVNMFFTLGNTLNVHTFDLCIGRYVNFDWNCHVNRWIRNAVMRNVKVLQIRAKYSYPVFADYIFSDCQSLEALSLIYPNPLLHRMPPKIIGLRLLKSMDLSKCFIRHNLIQRIVNGCPLLEDLHLKFCRLDTLDISSHTLKRLTIMHCKPRSGIIRISTPSLVSLYYGFSGFHKASLENLSSLVSASIIHDKGFYAEPESTGSAHNLIRGLSNSKTLELSASWIFEIYKLPVDMNYTEPSWKCGELSFDCPRLTMIEILIRCKKNERVCQLVEFLQANAKALQNLIIVPCPRDLGV